MLTHDELDSPKDSVATARSHDRGSGRAFAIHHQLSGKKFKELPERATTEFLENVEAVAEDVEQLERLMQTYAGSDEEPPS